MLRHLAPIIIPETVGTPSVPNAAFEVVKELISAIKDSNIKNVAVSADYGAGKSSVVETAKAKINSEEDIHWWQFKRKRKQTRFLTISLAQLNANGRLSNKTKKTQPNDKVVDKDKDVEYSLLQQLLYYDLPSKTPKSRFNRLGRIHIWTPLKWAIGILLAVISYLVLLEPDRFKVLSFCERFAVEPETKFRVDCAAVIVLALLFTFFCVWLVKHARVRIGKVKVKDAEVEMENLSVFNQYLDEIIYFFASTRYNVVIFEDLDRFADTSRIFGKLRELNKILNNSKYLQGIIHREITFIYSVRDDLFDATRRVKFFDYIVPVIPVVNSSNAYEKLMEYLSVEDKRDFDGKDLLNLCEFFEDMRLIINIVNEYDLYKRVIRIDDFNLSRKKLFGLVVYKNYCPHDFVHLHNRHGVLANILDNKKAIADAVVGLRRRHKESEVNKLEALIDKSALWEKELRKEYVEASKLQANHRSSIFEGFELQNGVHVSFDQLAGNSTFFEELVNDKISFYGSDMRLYPIAAFANWQKAVNPKSYQERLKLNPYTRDIASQQEVVDNIKPLKFTSANSFSSIIKEEISILDGYLDTETDGRRPFIPKERHQLLRFLLMHDFLDEHYLDYITYFYQNSISVEDKQFILNITSMDKDSLPCTFSLQNPVSVADRFDLSDYKTNTRLLNVDLALSMTREGEEQKTNRNALQRLAVRSNAIDFVLAVYERQSEPEVDAFLAELLELWDFGVLIQSLSDKGDERLPILREINLRYSNLKDPEMFNGGFKSWLSGHFGFLATVFEAVGEDRLRVFLDVYKPKFSKINLATIPPSFAGFILERSFYSINASNIDNITSFLGILDDYKKASYTTLHNCRDLSLASLVKQEPQEFIKVFPLSSTEEAPWALDAIANNSKISSTTRKEYLKKQSSRIGYAKNLKEPVLDWAFKNSLIVPSWENLYYLCFEMLHSAPLEFLRENTLDGFLLLKLEQQNAVVNQWVFSNNLSFDVYGKVVSTMSGFRKLTPGVEPRRIELLIKGSLLLFNSENYSEMRRAYPSLAPMFITLNLKTYLGDITNYPVSSEEMTAVLESFGTIANQAGYIASHPTFEGKPSTALSDIICELIQNRSLLVEEVEEKLLMLAIKYSSEEESRMFAARKALFTLDYTYERCTAILNAMGGEYARICEPGSYTWLTRNANNTRIAKYLKENGFVKDYERYGERIKVLKR
jgi:hypothetical protein